LALLRQNLEAKDVATGINSSATIVVTPLAPVGLSVSGSPSPDTAGAQVGGAADHHDRGHGQQRHPRVFHLERGKEVMSPREPDLAALPRGDPHLPVGPWEWWSPSRLAVARRCDVTQVAKVLREIA
jgi:hypothetical protein